VTSLTIYVPRLQSEQGIVWFLRQHPGQLIPSAALMGSMSRSFVAALEDLAAQRGVPLEQFRKGQRKDDVMAEHLRQFSSNEGVVFIGKAQVVAAIARVSTSLRRPSRRTRGKGQLTWLNSTADARPRCRLHPAAVPQVGFDARFLTLQTSSLVLGRPGQRDRHRQ
jgi:hypothetical protein